MMNMQSYLSKFARFKNIGEVILNTIILHIIYIFSHRGRWLQRKVWIIWVFELHSCPRNVLKELLLPVKDNTTFTKIFTKTKNWKKWGTGAQWNNLIIFYTNQYDIILKLDLHSNKNKLSQKGDLLSQGHENRFKT